MQRRKLLALSAGVPVLALARRARAEVPAKPAVDPTLQARAELLATLVETSSVAVAIKRHPAAKLAADQVKALESVTAAELAAVKSFQTKLAKAKLPALVLRRETIARLAAGDGLVALTNQPPERMSPPTNLPPEKRR